MPLGSIIDGRSCRLRGIDACRLHDWFLAGGAPCEASTRAVGIHGSGQELPPARHQCRLLACISAGRCCLQALLLAGAAVFELLLAGAACMNCRLPEPLFSRHRRRRSRRAGGIHGCWQELPPARPQRMPLALLLAGAAHMPCGRPLVSSEVAGRGCRRRGLSTFRGHPWWRAGVAGRSCRRRGLSTCRVHALLPVGAAAFDASSRDVCVHCCWQELPPAILQRMPLA